MKTNYQLQVILKLKILRENKGYTQAEVAKTLGISPGQLGNIESPKMPHKFTLKQIYVLCELLNVDIVDVFLSSDQKKTNIETKLLIKQIIEYQENESL